MQLIQNLLGDKNAFREMLTAVDDTMGDRQNGQTMEFTGQDSLQVSQRCLKTIFMRLHNEIVLVLDAVF